MKLLLGVEMERRKWKRKEGYRRVKLLPGVEVGVGDGRRIEERNGERNLSFDVENKTTKIALMFGLVSLFDFYLVTSPLCKEILPTF